MTRFISILAIVISSSIIYMSTHQSPIGPEIPLELKYTDYEFTRCASDGAIYCLYYQDVVYLNMKMSETCNRY